MGELAMDEGDALSPAAGAAPPTPKRRSRSRVARWTFRGVTFIMLLILAIVISLQIILWTDLPRQLVLQKLQAALGLRVEAPRMSIGWWGRTSLEDVKISLPLAEQSLLSVPRLDVTHTSLLMIMLTQDVTVKEMAFYRPQILVTQDAGGRWNVADALDLITRAGGKEQAQDKPEKQLVLPAVSVDQGTLRLIDRAGREAIIEPVEVSGIPDGPLVWKYEAWMQERLRVTGQVSPGGAWEEDVSFAIDDVGPWLGAWMKNVPNVRAKGSWHGRVEGENINGRVTFDQLSAGTLSATGGASIQRQASGDLVFTPDALIVRTQNPALPEMTLHGGALVLAATSASAKDLAVLINGGEAKLNGAYSWADQSASLDAAWHEIAFPNGATHQGNLIAKFSMPWPGAPRLEAQIDSSGRTSAGQWSSHATITGNGRAWNDIDWTANIAHASWSGKHSAAISDLKATALLRDNKITLQTVALGGHQDFSGSGELALDDLSWRLQLNGGGIPIRQLSDAPASIRFRASGKTSGASLDELTLTAGQVEIHAGGFYDSANPKPVALSVEISHLPSLQGSDPNAPLHGDLYGKASLSGTLSPLDLGINQGMLYGTDLAIGKRDVGRLAIQLQGSFTEQRAHLETTEALLLSGKWRVRADWPDEQDALRVQVGVRELSLAEIGDLLRQKNLSGTLAGSWIIEIPAADRTRITSTGSAELRDLVAGRFQAQRITAQSRFERGTIVLDPIELQQQDGSAQAHVDLATDHPTLLNVKADVKNWPATAPTTQASATLWAQTELAIDTAKKSASGPLNAQLAFRINDRDAGTLSVDSTLDGRIVHVSRIQAAALGGSAQGSGEFSLDEPMQSTGKLDFDEIDAAKVAAFIPRAKALLGTVSGSLELARSDDPRAIGPLKLTANIAPRNLYYKTVEIDDASLTSYFTGTRFVLDHSTVHLAGGDLHVWARSTTHEQGVRSSQLQIEFHDLNLDKLDHAFDPDPKSVPGRLTGAFVLIGSPQNRDTLFGQGSMKITDSNLTNVRAIDGLNDQMHAGQTNDANDGTGQISLRLDNNTLTLDNAHYLHRGMEVRGQVMLRKIWDAPDSPIDGTLIGSLRPLKDIKLPYFADADSILNALQQNVTSVRLEGTARDYRVVPITLSEAGETMQKILLGEVQKK